MSYVMMPVPEEHVEEVMSFILRAIERASIESWDRESVGEAFELLDEASKSLLAFVAKATLQGQELADSEAARQIQLTVRETAGVMSELHQLCREMNHPPLLSSRVLSELLPNGRLKDRRVLQMDIEVAEFVKEVQAAELAGMPVLQPETAE